MNNTQDQEKMANLPTAHNIAILMAFGTDAEVVQYYLDQPLTFIEKEKRIYQAMQWLDKRQELKSKTAWCRK